MNILQILPKLETGGVETGVVDFSKELSKRGHKSVVASAGGKLVKEIIQFGAVHYTLPVDKKNPLVIIGMVNRIRDIIRKEGIDIVHARSRAPAYSAFFAAYLEKRPFITTCHGYYSTHILSRVMGWGKYVVVASQSMAKHMIDDFGVPIERIRLISRGVDLEKLPYKEITLEPKKEYTVGIIGRITPLKGHTHFIRALSKVVRVMPHVKAPVSYTHLTLPTKRIV